MIELLKGESKKDLKIYLKDCMQLAKLQQNKKEYLKLKKEYDAL